MNCSISGLKLSILALTVASAVGVAQAQEQEKPKRKHHKHKDMEVMVVTASGVAQHLKEAPASISVIDRRELSQRFYKDLTDAMTDAPGVIVTGGGDRQDISLRGMGADYTLILVDGQRQSSRETRPNSDGPGVEGAWTPPLAAIASARQTTPATMVTTRPAGSLYLVRGRSGPQPSTQRAPRMTT